MLSDRYLDRVDPTSPIRLFIFPTPKFPSVLLGQLNPALRYLEWLLPSNSPSKTLSPYLEMITDLIIKGQKRCTQLSGCDLQIIHIPTA